ncbi:MAG: gliding motility-associated C-terminal domain-containing protein, partial [Flavobacteriaceae bacterium]
VGLNPLTSELVDGTTYYAFQGLGTCATSLAITVHLQDEIEAPDGDENQYFCDSPDLTLADLIVSTTLTGAELIWFDVDDNTGTPLASDTLIPDTDVPVTYYAFQGLGTCAESLAVSVITDCIPEITLVKSANDLFCVTDLVINYELVVTNSGNIPLTNIVITDANADGTIPGIGSILPGESVTLSVVHTITEVDRLNGVVINSASVIADAEAAGTTVEDLSDDINNPTSDDDPTYVYGDTDCDGLINEDDIDDDNDGITDIVENGGSNPTTDADGDNIPQYLDDNDNDASIGDDDGLPQNDTDGDNLPNHLDIDSDGDGIPDNVEGQTTLDYINPLGEDTDGDGLDDAYDIDDSGIIPVNSDLDATPDYLDTDSDNDNVLDNVEGNDFNHDGLPDSLPTGNDSDFDGLDDGYESDEINDTDLDIDPLTDLPDNDEDAIEDGDVDFRDDDDDNDDIPTIDEDNDDNGDYANDDCDLDGIPDYLDVDPCFIEMPTGFTPNGDDGNDTYFIDGLANLYPNFSIEIYDRYGNIVYDYTHDGSSTDPDWWNGISSGRWTTAQNKLVPAGTYYYILNPNRDGYKRRVGWLYINR